MRVIGGVAIFALAANLLAWSPVAAKPAANQGWTCQFDKGGVVMERRLEVDPAPPRGNPAAAQGSALTGKVELVLRQDIIAGGVPNRVSGKDYFVVYIRDNDGAIRLGADGTPLPSGEFLFDRAMPEGGFRGMFRQRAPEALGRRLDADFSDLTSSAPPFLHFVARSTNAFETRRLFLRVPTGDFQALYTRGLQKAVTATADGLRPC